MEQSALVRMIGRYALVMCLVCLVGCAARIPAPVADVAAVVPRGTPTDSAAVRLARAGYDCDRRLLVDYHGPTGRRTYLACRPRSGRARAEVLVNFREAVVDTVFAASGER